MGEGKNSNHVAGDSETNVRYLILADDLTGALDTGMQLRRLGIPTKVLDGYTSEELFQYTSTPAMVVNTNSRHICPESAYQVVWDICQEASNYQINLIYKKTDSVLRGNICAELQAIVASGFQTIYFAPAYPKLNRITRDGQQLIDEVPVNQSSFGKDIFNPIKTAFIPELLEDIGLPITVVSQQMDLDTLQNHRGIYIFDAETDEQLGKIAAWVAIQPGKFALAGCAGFAEHLKPILHYNRQVKEPEILTYDGMIVISGSLNPLSFTQVQVAANAGFDVISVEDFAGFVDQDDFEVTEEIVQKIIDVYKKNRSLIIRTTSSGADYGNTEETLKAGQRVANRFGLLVKKIRTRGIGGLFVVSGGDTLGSIVKHTGGHSIEPLLEIEPGVVLANISTDVETCQFITKSGGIGSADIYCAIKDIFIK